MGAPQQGAQRASPTVLRILIGIQLRKRREQAGLTCEQAGRHVRMVASSISRIENGRFPFDRPKARRDVADLLTVYGVTDELERDQLFALIEDSGQRGWWQRYGDVLPGWFETYVGLEGDAEQIQVFEVQLVPGLLQTHDYMRAVLATEAAASAEEVEQRVKLRADRQHILTTSHAPRLWVLLDEGAVRRVVGGPAVMRSQLEHLITMASLPNVTIQVLAFAAGAARIPEGGGYTILRFRSLGLPDIAYTETLTGATYAEKRHEVEQYAWAFDRMATASHDPAATLDLLHRIHQEVPDEDP